ncbi:MAG: hypothetical protein KJ624_04740 [Chloroflexi bacterium]|nr:hypothetical protein [Chloroflexota bacterium]
MARKPPDPVDKRERDLLGEVRGYAGLLALGSPPLGSFLPTISGCRRHPDYLTVTLTDGAQFRFVTAVKEWKFEGLGSVFVLSDGTLGRTHHTDLAVATNNVFSITIVHGVGEAITQLAWLCDGPLRGLRFPRMLVQSMVGCTVHADNFKLVVIRCSEGLRPFLPPYRDWPVVGAEALLLEELEAKVTGEMARLLSPSGNLDSLMNMTLKEMVQASQARETGARSFSELRHEYDDPADDCHGPIHRCHPERYEVIEARRPLRGQLVGERLPGFLVALNAYLSGFHDWLGVPLLEHPALDRSIRDVYEGRDEASRNASRVREIIAGQLGFVRLPHGFLAGGVVLVTRNAGVLLAGEEVCTQVPSVLRLPLDDMIASKMLALADPETRSTISTLEPSHMEILEQVFPREATVAAIGRIAEDLRHLEEE